jgi:hypothetical protein
MMVTRRIFNKVMALSPLASALGSGGPIGDGSAAAAVQGLAEAVLTVDVAADRQVIHPEIYGVMFAMTADLKANNTTLNRAGGNFTSRYNRKLNASNHTMDWYFESRPELGGPGRPGRVR